MPKNSMDKPLKKPTPEWLEEQLFARVDDVTSLYAIIDGQWCRDIYGYLEGSREELAWTGLIAGEQAQELALTSPYLIRLEPGHKLNKWLFGQGWGQGWGIYFHANTKALEAYRKPPAEPHGNELARTAFVEAPGAEEDTANDVKLLRRHFRKFQRVEFEDDGRLVRFRFFDPAVLRVYLMTCNAAEVEAFFGPAISYFLSEDYCEELTLCRPYMVYRFHRPSAGEVEIRRHDYRSGQLEVMRRFSTSKEQAERPGLSIIPLIRNGQIKVFEQMQMEIFTEKVAWDLIRVGDAEGHGRGGIAKIRAFVATQIKRAQFHDLTTEYDLKGYVFCAWHLGVDFATEDEEAKAALSERALLGMFFKKHVYRRGST